MLMAADDIDLSSFRRASRRYAYAVRVRPDLSFGVESPEPMHTYSRSRTALKRLWPKAT
jgi:hypothetical protein